MILLAAPPAAIDVSASSQAVPQGDDHGDDDDEDDDDSDDDSIKVYGRLESRPAGNTGVGPLVPLVIRLLKALN